MERVKPTAYSIFRRDLGLSEGRAKELVEAIDTTVKDRVELRCDQSMGLIRKDIQSLKEVMDIRFNAMEERLNEKFKVVDERFRIIDERFKGVDEKFNALDVKFATKEDLANTKAELIKWNLVFWAGTLISFAGLLFTAFKFYLNK